LLLENDHLVDLFDDLIESFVGIAYASQMLRYQIKGVFVQEVTISLKLINDSLTIDFDIHGAKLYPRTIINLD
jgi:hypothetical protein